MYLGCRHEPQTGADPIDAGATSRSVPSVVPRTVASAVTTNPAEPIIVKLGAQAPQSTSAKHRKRVLISVVAQVLGLDEPLVELAFPHVCQAATSDDGAWTVRCTPKVFHPVAQARFEMGTWVLGTRQPSSAVVAPPFTTRRLNLPSGRTVRFEDGRVHVRSPPEAACAAAAPSRTVDIFLQSADSGFPPKGSMIYLIVPEAAPMMIARHWKSLNCAAAQDSEADYRFACGTSEIACKLSVQSDRVQFDCTEPESYSGSVLLPCGSRGRFPMGALRIQKNLD
jgi:hypothetical protein